MRYVWPFSAALVLECDNCKVCRLHLFHRHVELREAVERCGATKVAGHCWSVDSSHWEKQMHWGSGIQGNSMGAAFEGPGLRSEKRQPFFVIVLKCMCWKLGKVKVVSKACKAQVGGFTGWTHMCTCYSERWLSV